MKALFFHNPAFDFRQHPASCVNQIRYALMTCVERVGEHFRGFDIFMHHLIPELFGFPANYRWT